MGVTHYSGPTAVQQPTTRAILKQDPMAQELVPKLPAVTAIEDWKVT